MSDDNPQTHWDEETSSRYIDYGCYFVPAHEQQMIIVADLLKGLTQPITVVELCCGEGSLGDLLHEWACLVQRVEKAC